MLNEAHQYLIKETIQRLFFAEIETLPSDIQFLACKAALSFSFYAGVESTLKAHNLDTSVREIGRLLTHPCPENPNSLCIELGEKSSLDPLLIIEKKDGSLKVSPIGILNLKVKNTPDFEAQAEEVIDFVKKLITTKFPDIEDLSKAEVVTPEENRSPSSEDFSKLPTSKQLKILEISVETLPKCKPDNFSFFQQFLMKVGTKKESLDSIDDLNKCLEKWHSDIKKEYEGACAVIGQRNQSQISLANIVDAKLGRFDLIMQSQVNFYTFWALQRIALANGHTGMIEYLKPDFSDIVRLLVRAKKKDELREILKEQGKKIPHYHANFIWLKYFEEEELDIEIVELLLENLAISDHYKVVALEASLRKKTQKDFIAKLLCGILFELKLTERLSLEAAKEAFQIASESASFQLLVSVLLHSPNDFLPRMFINREVFFGCLKQGLVQIALKIAAMEFPQGLSIQDLNEAEIVSQGKISFHHVSAQNHSFAFSLKPKQDNPQPITPLLQQFLQTQQMQSSPTFPLPARAQLRPK